jgi:cytochrome P450
MFRNVVSDVEIAGTTIPAGSLIWLAFASGNRDPATFADEASFDPVRDAQGHLAFSQGTHFCLGASLGRVEARIGVEALLDRLDDITLAADKDLEYVESFMIHGLTGLPLTFTARS